ncbi:Ldh family oxidoreductase [Xanthomonas translucens pv. graminis]|uniref:Ldh family oxidoreductase n=1 Tax=Xanthomonas graminis TaxID=3390026 RepID=UPI002541D87F|nr:Ldh family oxidoreductase [Xanthomonas translucens]WIH03731.1 Ldh family oxidoreductase [Xanthomonas translucens pv. graminis]
MNASDPVTLSLDQATALVERILRHAGFGPAHVRTLTATIVAGERDGCASHGLYRTLGCVATLRNGKVAGDAEPVVHDQAPAIVRVDACGGFSLLAFERGLPSLIEKARGNGLAALAINHCVHFSALWPEVERITEAGLVALICNPSHAWVTPAGGHTPLLGTNPLAFGWPRVDALPFVFDFATSAVARGEIELHRRAGLPIPEGWGVDASGRPTTDPNVVAGGGGAMLTFGGHKGSALSAMIELIAGPLIGDLTSAESLAHDAGAGASPYHGELILALDPVRFLGAEWAAHMARAEAFFAAYQDTGARLPSQRRYQARARSLREGVRIPQDLHQDLLKLLE